MEIRHLENPPLISCSLILDLKPERRISKREYTEFAKKHGAQFKIFGKRTVKVVDNEDERIEHVIEDRAAGVSFFVQDDVELIVSPLRIECRISKAYTKWENFISLARMSCKEGLDFVNPERVVGVTVLSVNKIEISQNSVKLSDLIKSTPVDIEGDIGICVDMKYRDTQYYKTFSAFATVTKEYQRQKGQQPALYFSTEVFKVLNGEKECSIDEVDFEILRNLKNRLFFDTLTDNLLEKYICKSS